MSNVREMRTEAHRYEEASIWIARLDRGLPDEVALELKRWMAIDPANAEVLLQMASVWDKMDDLSRLSEVVPHSAAPHPAPKTFRPIRHWYAAVASMLVVVLAGAGGFWASFLDEDWQRTADTQTSTDSSTYETAVGAQSTVALSDGTQIILNTDSRMRVAYSAERRLVYLERGEIHVNVAHDASRPLSVIVGNQVIRALGTAFSVKIDSGDQIDLVVTDGRVQVGVRSAVVDSPELFSEVLLFVAQGEAVTLGSSDEAVERLAPEDIEVRLSWREGNLIFRGEALGDAVAEISRYTSVEFVFTDEDLEKVRVAGLFKAGDVAGFLAALRSNFDITSERIDDDKILLKPAVVHLP